MLALPVVLGIGSGLFGIGAALLSLLLTLVIGIAAVTLALVLGGIVAMVGGVIVMAANFPVGLLILGIGILTFGLGLLGIALSVVFYGCLLYTSSAATSTEEIGNPIHHGTMAIFRKYHIPCTGHRAVQMKKSDYDAYDYIIGMDNANIRNIPVSYTHLDVDKRQGPDRETAGAEEKGLGEAV